MTALPAPAVGQVWVSRRSRNLVTLKRVYAIPDYGEWVDWMSLTAPDGRRWSWGKSSLKSFVHNYEFVSDSEDDL